jgi:hypothetical protein
MPVEQKVKHVFLFTVDRCARLYLAFCAVLTPLCIKLFAVNGTAVDVNSFCAEKLSL